MKKTTKMIIMVTTTGALPAIGVSGKQDPNGGGPVGKSSGPRKKKIVTNKKMLAAKKQK